jgi:hypothetical protein
MMNLNHGHLAHTNPNITIPCWDTRNNTFTNKTVNYGNESTFYIHGYSTGGYAFIKFDLTVLAGLTNVDSAVLKLNIAANSLASNQNIDVKKITASWDEMTLNGTTYPPMNSPAESTFTFPSGVTNTWISTDVTSLFNSWLSGGSQNYGFGIDPVSSWPSGNDSSFVSSENITSDRRPLIEWTKSGTTFTAQCEPN